MRRLLLLGTLLAVALALVASASARSRAVGDGTLAVTSGKGRVALRMTRGVIIGQIRKGSIKISDPMPSDNVSVTPLSACTRDLSDGSGDTPTTCTGTNLRFLITGPYTVKIAGSGIDLSIAGRGTAWLNGDGDLDNVVSDGRYSLNGDVAKSLPDLGASVLIGDS